MMGNVWGELVPDNTCKGIEGDKDVDWIIIEHVRDKKVLDQANWGLDHVDCRPIITQEKHPIAVKL